jgi:phage terminase large subunit GpA-like protein
MVLPEPALLVTAAIDVQIRYLALLTMGWAPTAEAWVLDWRTVEGDPRDPATLRGALEDLATETFAHPSGQAVPVHFVGVDSGFCATQVYDAIRFAPRRAWKWCWATKGVGGRAGEPIVLQIRDERDPHVHRIMRPLPINTDGAKAELFSMLRIPEPGRGYVHIPKRVGSDFIRQLTSEEERTKLDRDGIAVGTTWAKVTDRNEALDCACICLALFHHLRPQGWLRLLEQRHGVQLGQEKFKTLFPQVRIVQPPASPPHNPFLGPGAEARWLNRRLPW